MASLESRPLFYQREDNAFLIILISGLSLFTIFNIAKLSGQANERSTTTDSNSNLIIALPPHQENPRLITWTDVEPKNKDPKTKPPLKNRQLNH